MKTDITNAVRESTWYARVGKLFGMSHEDKRSLYDIYGYPLALDGDLGFRLMYEASRRQGIANRITHGVPKTCWRDGFTLQADEEVVLAEQLAELNVRGFAGALERVDILNRIGRNAVLLIGVPDGLPLTEPMGAPSGRAIASTYFKPFAFDAVRVDQLEQDTLSPRYGLPLMYTLGGAHRDDKKTLSNIGTIRVHYSRVVHLNESELDDYIEGTGALEPVFNRILDMDKSCGGSAEAYFRNARGKIAYEIDKDFASQLLNDETQKEKFDENVKKFTNEWQDHTIAAGAKVKTLDTTHYSPLDTVKVGLWEISGYTGIPIRILTGEGSGQLAGSEDQLAMNQLIADRQRAWCAVMAMRALELLDRAGVIKLPPGAAVVFPQQGASTEKEQAEIDNKRATTLQLVAAAKSAIGGDEIDMRSALDALNLADIALGAADDVEE